MKRFTSLKEARIYAAESARQFRINYAIRKIREFGIDGFNVDFARSSELDNALVGFVFPGDPA
jgi:hypothetical protein